MPTPALRVATGGPTGDGSAYLRSSLTINNPGAVQGDYMIAVLVAGYGSTGLALTGAPAGWTPLYTPGAVAKGDGGYDFIYFYGKLCGAGEPGSWTWTFNNQFAFFNTAIGVWGAANLGQPYEGLSSGSAGSQGYTAGGSGGLNLVRGSSLNIPGDNLVSVWVACPAGADPYIAAVDSGTVVYQSSGADSADMLIGFSHIPNVGAGAAPISPIITATIRANSGSTMAVASIQLGLLPDIISVGKSISQPFGLRALAGKSALLPYSQVGAARKSLAMPYNKVAFVGGSRALPYGMRALAGRSSVQPYTVRELSGASRALRFGIGEAPPIPGRSNADTYSDGASAVFGAPQFESTDMSIFATTFGAWEPPLEEDLWYARLPYELAQQVLGAAGPVSTQRATCSWHGTVIDPERGSFAVVKSGTPLAALVGERVRITSLEHNHRSVVAYVNDESSDLFEDISVSRRLFASLGYLVDDFIDVRVEVLG